MEFIQRDLSTITQEDSKESDLSCTNPDRYKTPIAATKAPQNTPDPESDVESGEAFQTETLQSEPTLQLLPPDGGTSPSDDEIPTPYFDPSQTPPFHHSTPSRTLVPVAPTDPLSLPPRHRRCFDWRMTDSDVDYARDRAWFKSYRKLQHPAHKANSRGAPPVLIGDADTGLHQVLGIGTVAIRVLRGPYVYGTTTVWLRNVLHVPTMGCNGFGLERLMGAVGGVRAEFSPPKCLVYGPGGTGEEGGGGGDGGGDRTLVFLKKDAVLVYKLMLPQVYPWSEFEAIAKMGDVKSLSFVLDPEQRAWFENLRR